MDGGLILIVTAFVMFLAVRAVFLKPTRPPYEFRPEDEETETPDAPSDAPPPRPTYGAARYRTKRLKRGPSE